MDIFNKISSDTDKSKLIEDNRKIFKLLADNMIENKILRYLFLTGFEELSREETKINFEEPILHTLSKHKIDRDKSASIVKDIVGKISGVMSEKRAVSIKEGNIGLIEPFKESMMDLEGVSPSIRHIYTSYFSNLFSITEGINKSLSVNISTNELIRAINNIPNNLAKKIETLYVCQRCNRFSTNKIRCKHKNGKYTLSLFKINEIILDGWYRDIILSVYMKNLFERNEYKVLTETNINGSGKNYHQIDIMAIKGKRVIIGECKRYSLSGKGVSENDIMKFLGRAEDIGFYLKSINKDFDIIKVIITTGKLNENNKKIASMIEARNDVIFIKNDEIKDNPERWLHKL